MATPPQLSVDARNEALAKAALVRVARSELKDQIKAGAITLENMFSVSDTDEIIGKLKVLTMLESLPGLGKVKARRVMDEVGIADSRRVRGLGPHQRTALLQKLG
jgi:hypothetical protein